MSNKKEHISVVLLGHSNSGKSATLGYLIYQVGGIPWARKKNLEKRAKEIGKEYIKYAWILDKLRAEKEAGNSTGITLWKIRTSKYLVTIIEAEKSTDYITGTSQADCALLVVSATAGEFEDGMLSGWATKEHALLAHKLGVKQIIVAVNKMDTTEPQYSESRFDQVRNELSDYLKKVGYGPNDIFFVPISATKGDNVTESSSNMPWFEDGAADLVEDIFDIGKKRSTALLEALDAIVRPQRDTDKPLRIPLEDVYAIGGAGTMVDGRVQAGTFRPGDRVIFVPVGISGVVRSIEKHGEPLTDATAGDIVTFNVPKVAATDLKPGMVCGSITLKLPAAVSSFKAQVTLLKRAGEINPGFSAVLFCHTAQVACKFTELIERLDSKTEGSMEENPSSLKSGDVAIVSITPSEPSVVETLEECPALGRFVIQDKGQTVAFGVVKGVEKIESHNVSHL